MKQVVLSVESGEMLLYLNFEKKCVLISTSSFLKMLGDLVSNKLLNIIII